MIRILKITVVLVLWMLIGSDLVASNKTEITRIDPSFWFVGMNNPTLHLLVSGNDFTGVKVEVNYEGVSIIETRVAENSQYLFLDLRIEKNTIPGLFTILFTKDGKTTKKKYEVKARTSSHKHIGLSQADLIYLIMPDRFANGNSKNDIIKGTEEDSLNRANDFGRHGGDLQGITDHLDYIQKLGMTALWLNPADENNEPKESYHGYAITDHYKVDSRLGTNTDYENLITSSHQRDLKIIKDVVFNHFGDQHYLIKNLPSKNWINHWEEYTQSNFRAPTVFDPHASEADKKKFQNGWFDHHMPDMNQADPDLANYLIQNSLWWIEAYDIDAYRIDTYAYSDQKFMANWAEAIMTEYPNFFLFGETWVHGKAVQGYFVNDSSIPRPYPNYMQSVTDFQMYYSLTKTATQPFGWTEGVASVYYTLAQDLIYPHSENLVTFLDNHDLARFYGVVNQDMDKFKMGYGMLMTMRGIPQVLYGSEILMAGTENHGIIREDFWGGWESDSVNKFTQEGRSELENEAFDYMKLLANWRKNSPAITKGQLTQFVPDNGMYVYFRYTDNQTVMIVVNASEKGQDLKLSRFIEFTDEFKTGKDIIKNQDFELDGSWSLKPWEIRVLELR
jgi:glycosidase